MHLINLLYHTLLFVLSMVKCKTKGEREVKKVNKVKFYREKRKWSVRQLADKAGVTPPTIYDIESEKPADIKFSTMLAISKALNLTIDTLFLP